MLLNGVGKMCELRFENGDKCLLELTSVEQERSTMSVSMIHLTGYLLRYFNPIRLTPSSFKYEKVIYHNPATIVLWKDGTKTVVKCDPKDTYDPEKGLALCFMKKALGNKSRAINDILHKEEIKK